MANMTIIAAFLDPLRPSELISNLNARIPNYPKPLIENREPRSF